MGYDHYDVIQGNELLRDIFQMGPAPTITVETKASRLERVSVHTCTYMYNICMPDSMV